MPGFSALGSDVCFQTFRVEMGQDKAFDPRKTGHPTGQRWGEVPFHRVAVRKGRFQDQNVRFFRQLDNRVAKARVPRDDNGFSSVVFDSVGQTPGRVEGRGGLDAVMTVVPLSVFSG